MKTWAVVRTSAVDFHQWPDAPATVFFLRAMHRHVFYYEVHIEQFHDDRDIEFTLFKSEVDDLIIVVNRELGMSRSCEMIAKALLAKLRLDYRGRALKVSVFEDNENGAMLELDSKETISDN